MTAKSVKQGLFVHAPKSASTPNPNETIKLVLQPLYNFSIPPSKQQIKHMRALQGQDSHLQIVIKYLKNNDHTEQYKKLPILIRINLLQNRYSLNNDNLLVYKEPNHSSQFVVPFTPKMATDSVLKSKTLSGITIDFNTILMIQSNDPYLTIIKQCLTEQDPTEFTRLYKLLPPKFQKDIFSRKYHFRQQILYFQKGFNFHVVLPPTKYFYKINPLIKALPINASHLSVNDMQQFYNCYLCCYACGETGHVATMCPNQLQTGHVANVVHAQAQFCACGKCGMINVYFINTNCICVFCGHNNNDAFNDTYNESQSCGSPSNIYESNSNSNSTYSSTNSNSNSNRSKFIDGMLFYVGEGDKLSDYEHLKVGANHFIYNECQCILVCGECDFSFSKALIQRRNDNGIDMCITSWYYYSNQWYHGIPKEIGWEQFKVFLNNLKYCKNKGAKITFGIDAKYLYKTEKKWNKIQFVNNGFDTIVFTLPRVHDEKWNKIKYNQENEILLMKLLKSAADYLNNNNNAQIHILLLKGQFCNWRIRKVLNELNLELAFWSELDEELLNLYFDGYVPRDYYGNAMKIDDHTFHFCCFRKIMKQLQME